MPIVKQLFWFIAFLILIVLYGSFYTVEQGQKALVLRMGKIVTNSKGEPLVESPGLHFKLPFVDSIKWFDMRLQTLSVDSSSILTQEQQYVLVDYYAKWRIENIPLYYTRTGNDPDKTRLLLQQEINDRLRAEFGRRLLSDVISDARAVVMTKLQTEANKSGKNMGIAVIDVRIKRIDFSKEVAPSVFANMRADREKVAAKYRSEGKAAAEKIRAQADADATVILATAQANSAKIRAQGESEASKIYADAYSKDPEFYAFYKSLQAYKDIFNNNKENNIFVLKPDSQFFKYFTTAANNNNQKKTAN